MAEYDDDDEQKVGTGNSVYLLVTYLMTVLFRFP